jgi:hypothetical protein
MSLPLQDLLVHFITRKIEKSVLLVNLSSNILTLASKTSNSFKMKYRVQWVARTDSFTGASYKQPTELYTGPTKSFLMAIKY